MDRHLIEAHSLGSLVASVADDYHTVAVDRDRLTKAELAQTGRHGVDCFVVEARVVVVGPYVSEIPILNLHVSATWLNRLG